MEINGRNTSVGDAAYTLQNAAGAGNPTGTVISLSPYDEQIMLRTVGAAAVLTITHEVSFDNAATFENAFAEDLLAAAGIGTLFNTVANPGTLRHRYRIPPGATNFRTKITGFVSGNVTVTATVRTRS